MYTRHGWNRIGRVLFRQLTEKNKGTYLLGIHIEEDSEISIGKLKQGNLIRFPKGMYIYIGSALGTTSTALSYRLLRHTTRMNGVPHSITEDLAVTFRTLQLPCKIPSSKKLRWHIDYLLEDPNVSMPFVSFLTEDKERETKWVDAFYDSPLTLPFYKGFGGSDDRGRTHLFQIKKIISFDEIYTHILQKIGDATDEPG